jgi:polyhydroxyalkanoate synthesis regulator phasin
VAQKDAWRAYVELALGLTETSRKKAMKIASEVAGKGGATAEQLQELVTQAMANRDAMTRMIRVELDRTLGRVGLATMDEVEELTKRVRELEQELREHRATSPAETATHSVSHLSKPFPDDPASPNGAAATTSTGATAPAKKAVAKKAVAKKAVAKKAVATKTVATKTPAKKAASKATETVAAAEAPVPAPVPPVVEAIAKKTAAPKKTPAAKTADAVAKAEPARKAAAKKAPARKTARKASS